MPHFGHVGAWHARTLALERFSAWYATRMSTSLTTGLTVPLFSPKPWIAGSEEGFARVLSLALLGVGLAHVNTHVTGA